ncbi:MAG: type II secretion system GspH family protein [Lachnospiraceae bacterium]|nr:type II secretion system protein [Lachnospiraceae bacterium]MCR5530619.1 type II secretion system GspH family protein [Lachnospiraceae bacterium]
MDKASLGDLKRRVLYRKDAIPVIKKKRKKNGGFTLIEVLVAAAILSLVVTPILSSFVAIARVNAKSRRKLSATTIANGVMESVKNFELAQVAKECAFQSEGFHIIAGFNGTAREYTPGSTTVKSPSTVTKDGSGKYVFTASSSGLYTFGFVGVSMDNTTYDVLVTYRKNATKTAEQVTVEVANASPTTDTTSNIFDPMGLRVLTYYDVEIKVYRGGTNFSGTPLATISGSKADYTK